MGEIGGFSEKTFFDEKRRDSGRGSQTRSVLFLIK